MVIVDVSTKHILFDIKRALIFSLCCFYIGPVYSEEPLNSFSAVPASTKSALPSVDCVINPYRVVEIASPVRGVIKDILVERSDQVLKGQVVAKLASEVEKAGVELAKSRALIKSEIKVGQVNLDYDRRYKNRINSLYQEKVVSTELIEEAKRGKELSVWKLKQAQELSEIRLLELRRAEELLMQKTISSPIDGFVLDTFKYKGEYVEDQSIMRIAQLDPLIVEAIMPMENFGQVKVGMTAEVHPEVVSTDIVQAKVSVVDRIGDTASGTFGVRLEMPNPDNKLPAGIKCIVKINADSLIGLDDSHDKEKDKVRTFKKDSTYSFLSPEQDKPASELISPAEPPASATVNLESDESEYHYVFVEFDDISIRLGTNDPFYTQLKLENDQVAEFIVLIPQRKTLEESQDLIRLMQQQSSRKESDFQIIINGPYEGFISLGVFNTRKYAERLIKDMEKMIELSAGQ